MFGIRPSFGWDNSGATSKHARLRDEAYDRIGHAARFFNQSGVTFWEMAPNSQLASTRICLARSGVEYVVYAPTAVAFTLDLSAAKDVALDVRWFNPSTAEFRSDDSVSGGSGAQSFTPSFGEGAVLHLKRQANGRVPGG